ncbi:MAG: chloride channel protein [Alphaproteobacteria bacterium]|nr:chloride channel protein [Alphaproteobacteria bacterium]
MNNLTHNIQKFISKYVAPNASHFWSTKQPLVWIFAVIIGVAVAYVAIIFRKYIGYIQYAWIGETSEIFFDKLASVPLYLRILVPTLGGLLVGIIVYYFAPTKRPEGVADVIGARAEGTASISLKRGFANIIAAGLTLGVGGSAGREGPIVHFGASLASAIANFINIPPSSRRSLFGAGVAAAVSASFNAPIAGVLFALEVVLCHFAVAAFVPIVIASVVATLIVRHHLGDFPGFAIAEYTISSFWEFPAFALLGLVAAISAIGFQSTVRLFDKLAKMVKIHDIIRPAIGGFIIAIMSLFVPEIIGIGYEATNKALQGDYTLAVLFLLLAAKTVAVAVTLASRLVGGVFSPALYIGAMTGGAFGLMASMAFPELASETGVYAIIGMGAVTAAVLGAPISTVLIVFELTADYHITIALLLSVSIATGLSQAVQGQSIFHWQLTNKGIYLNRGSHRQIARNVTVTDLIDRCEPRIYNPDEFAITDTLTIDNTLEDAINKFGAFTDCEKMPVIETHQETGEKTIIGYVSHIRALQIYNYALVATNIEEHN